MRKQTIALFVAFALALPGAADTKKMKTDPAVHDKHSGSKSRAMTRIHNDATRLEALLLDVNHNVNLSEAAWRTIANEALVLANRINANVRSATAGKRSGMAARDAASSLRTHIRELHSEAREGDAAEARRHAREALPFAHTLSDWAA